MPTRAGGKPLWAAHGVRAHQRPGRCWSGGWAGQVALSAPPTGSGRKRPGRLCPDEAPGAQPPGVRLQGRGLLRPERPGPATSLARPQSDGHCMSCVCTWQTEGDSKSYTRAFWTKSHSLKEEEDREKEEEEKRRRNSECFRYARHWAKERSYNISFYPYKTPMLYLHPLPLQRGSHSQWRGRAGPACLPSLCT